MPEIKNIIIRKVLKSGVEKSKLTNTLMANKMNSIANKSLVMEDIFLPNTTGSVK